MSKTVEFFFDFGSPTAYLAWTQIPGLCERAGATLVYRPFLLGGVFKATGNQTPVAIPAKAIYMNADLGRFAARYGVALVFNPYFPINTLTLMRGAIGYQDTPDFEHYVATVMHAMWVEPRNLNDPAEVQAMLEAAGFDAADFAARTSDPAVKQRLIANTEEAVERGAFGAPTFFVSDAMFFGQDRLDFIAEALAAQH
jgi:2-hydroxychromene-2-carboxylate isomerase